MKKLFSLLLSFVLGVSLVGQLGVAQTNFARMLSGVNAQTGTTYTFQAIDATRMTSFNNSGSVAATLPAGTISGFGAGTLITTRNLGAGSLTITCACLIYSVNGAGATTLLLTQGQGTDLYSDGTNWVAQSSSVSSGGSSTGIVTAGLLAQFTFADGSGTTLTDATGNGNNGTFCAGGQAPGWISPANGPVGILFLSASSTCITLPASLNSARTWILVTSLDTSNFNAYQSPLSGNSTFANDWGALFSHFNGGLVGGAGNGPFAAPAVVSGQYSIGDWGTNVAQTSKLQSPQGTNIITWTLGSASDSTFDQIFVNSNIAPFGPVIPLDYNGAAGGRSAGLQTAGTLQFGGSGIGQLINSVVTYYAGTIYYALAYSTYLTNAQIAQNYQALVSILSQRGITLSHTNSPASAGGGRLNIVPYSINEVVAVGDSITAGHLTPTNYLQFTNFTSNGTWQWVDLGLSGTSAQTWQQDANANSPDSFMMPSGADNVEVLWVGTVDIGAGATSAQALGRIAGVARQHRLHFSGGNGNKIIVVPIMSSTGLDASKNSYDTLLRQNWRTIADGFADVASDPNLGADGASASTTFFVDGLHPTSNAQANDVAPIIQRAVNRLYGNNDWSAAATYTVAALGATATTAGGESGNTITLTFGATPANCQVGNQITVAGTTPAAYSGVWNILTRTATQVTYFTNATGLGGITVQGTGVCAQQQDADVYTILGGSAVAPAFTLESCVGYTGQNLYFKQTNTTSNWVLTPFQSSETIDGAATLAMPTSTSGNNSVVILQAQLVSSAAAGCTWKRLE